MTIPNLGIPVANGGRFTSISGRGRGSGRSSQWEFPDPLQMFSTSVPVTANAIRNRLNNMVLASVVGGFGGGGANLGTQASASATATPVVIFSGNNAGGGQIWRPTTNNGPLVWLQIDKTKTAVPAGLDDYGVTFVSCTAAYIGVTGSNALDAGLQMTSGGTILVASTGVGFAFLRTALNTIKLGVRVNGAAGLTQYALNNPATFDETIQHKYSFLCVSCTPTADAYVTAMIDMVPLKTISWGVGKTNVTAPVADSVNLGFFPQIIYGLNGGYHVKCPSGVEIISAPTITDAIY